MPTFATRGDPMALAMTELRKRRGQTKGRTFSGKPSVTVPEPATLIGNASGKEYATVGDRPDGKPESFIVPNEGPMEARVKAPASGGGGILESLAVKQLGPFTSDRDRLGKMWFVWAGPDAGTGTQAQWAKLKAEGLTDDIIKEYQGIDKRQPASMAFGGTGVAGGSPDDAQLREILSLRRQRLAASQDTANMAQVGMAQTLQNNEDARYGMLDVSTPANVNMPMGQSGGFASPLVRPSLRTNAEMLGEQINNKQEELSIDQAERGMNESPSLAGARGSSGGSRGGGGSTRSSGGGSGGSRATAQPASDYGYTGGTDVILQDPTTGQSIKVKQEDQRATEIKLAEKAASQRGNVLYDDPTNPNGIGQEMTPAQAALRKARDNAKIKQTLAAEAAPRSPYAALPSSTLVSYAIEGTVELPELEKELVARVDETGQPEYSRMEIDAIIRHVTAEKRKAAKKAGESDEEVSKLLADLRGKGGGSFKSPGNDPTLAAHLSGVR